MDERRFRELEEKRDSEGLTDEEASELGRMLAEREGREYGDAKSQPDPESEPEDESADEPSSEAQLKELREHPDVHDG